MNSAEKSALQKKSNLILLLTAIIWGSGFIPQKICANSMTAFAFNGFRYLIGSLLVLIITHFRLPENRRAWRITFLSGTILFLAADLQQFGIRYTTVGNTGFITTIYVVLVPFMGWLLFRQKITRSAFLAAAIALIGMYLLSTSGKALSTISVGDGIVFIGSVFWAIHILVVGKAMGRVDAMRFSAGQFLVCAFWNLLCWLIFDRGNLSGVRESIPLLLYTGIVVIGGGFTLQAVGQKHADESQAAIIFGLEAVFASFFGILFFRESFSFIQAVGAALIFISVVISVKGTPNLELPPI